MMFGTAEAERIRQLYGVGGTRDGRVVFWQRDSEGRLRTGKVMAYDPTSGRRTKGAGACDWVHSIMLRQGRLDEPYNLVQCLYGEHLLKREEYASATVAIVESYKTAHVGAILLPEMVWMAVDSLQGLTAERLTPLRGRDVVLYPDEGRGEELWREKIPSIAREVGFRYTLSKLIALYDSSRLDSSLGRDIADLICCDSGASAALQSTPPMGRTSSTTHRWLFRVSATSAPLSQQIRVCWWVGRELGSLGRLGSLGCHCESR
jgi:hypothetical protein